MIHYTTLWEILMKETSLTHFTLIVRMLDLVHFEGNKDQLVTQDDKKFYREVFEQFVAVCSGLKLNVCASATNNITTALSRTDITYSELREKCVFLREALRIEMLSIKWFSIESDRVMFISEKRLFGDDVSTAFPSITFDIEEAGKCMAFERWTAVMFHLMRIMEFGLRVLGDTLNIPATSNRTWDAILKKCDDEGKKTYDQKSPEWKVDEQFFAGAAAMLRSVKDAWRNPTMHIERVYTQEQTEDIWNAVKGFMRHLATRLKE